MLINRREVGRIALAGVVLRGIGGAQPMKYKGVRLGVGAYSFRGLPLTEVIRVLSAADCGGVELESPFVEPPREAGKSGPVTPEEREALRHWRLTVPMDEIKAIRQKLERNGVRAYAYAVPINDSFTDAEIDRVLMMTKALGAPVLNTLTTLPVAKRLASFADKHKMIIGLHPTGGNPNNPDAIGSADSYRKAFEYSPRIYANLDLYLYKNWGPDPLAFVKENHKRITSIHFHDRRTSVNPPAWVPFGEGDLPTKELLMLAMKNRYEFAFSIERIYNVPDIDHVREIRRSLDYCKRVLDGQAAVA